MLRMFKKYLIRRCIRFLRGVTTASFPQKALDLNAPPTLPQHVLVFRARGIEGLEPVSTDPEADDTPEQDKKEDGGKMGDSGDC